MSKAQILSKKIDRKDYGEIKVDTAHKQRKSLVEEKRAKGISKQVLEEIDVIVNHFKFNDQDINYILRQIKTVKEKPIVQEFGIREKFNELNRKYFNNSLSMPVFQVGYKDHNTIGRSFVGIIKLKKFIFSKVFQQYNFWQDVLLHEMIHYRILTKLELLRKLDPNNVHNDEAWKSEVKRISKLLGVKYNKEENMLVGFPMSSSRPENYRNQVSVSKLSELEILKEIQEKRF